MYARVYDNRASEQYIKIKTVSIYLNIKNWLSMQYTVEFKDTHELNCYSPIAAVVVVVVV